MPDGKTHREFNRKNYHAVLIIGGIVSSLLLAYDPVFAGIYFIGHLFGFVLVARWSDPDLDQLGLTAAEGRAMNDLRKIRIPRKGIRRYLRLLLREIGGWIGFVWVWWHMPYAYVMRYFGGHRGLSHWHIVGTVTRFVWAFWPAFYLWWWFYCPYPEFIVPLSIGVFSGLAVMDSLHIHLDMTY